MPFANPIIASFNAGELCPELYGRVDLAKYYNGCRILQNFIPTVHGPAERRPGTDFVNEIVDSAGASNPSVKLIPFEFSTVQAYLLEFTEQQVRFYKDEGIITSGGSPYTVTTPYLASELADLHYTQSADVLYLVHPNHKPAKLMRYDHDDWRFKEISFLGTPIKNITGADKTDPVKVYCPAHGFQNEDIISIWGVQGMTDLNGMRVVTSRTDDSFKCRNVDGTGWSDYAGGGQAMKIKPWIYGATNTAPIVISLDDHGFANGDRIKLFDLGGMTEVNDKMFTVDNRTKDTFELKGTDGTSYGVYTSGGHAARWTELFEEEDHYPSCTEFFEERLFMANTNNMPQTIYGSQVGDYENFGTGPEDDEALVYTLAARGVNPILWLVPSDRFIIGTLGAEWTMQATGTDESITPSNVSIKRRSTKGSSDIQAILVADAVLYVQRGRRKVIEFIYSFEKDGFNTVDLTRLSKHITAPGIIDIDYRQEPQSVLWAIREDGVLLSMVYERAESVVGWSRHITDGEFVDVATISGDDTYVAVRRNVQGIDKLYLERFGNNYLDSALEWSNDGQVDITAITNQTEALVTAPGFYGANGDHVRFANCEGMIEMNGHIYEVSDLSGDSFKLKNEDGSYVNTVSYGTYTGGGDVEVVKKSFTGADHLAGKTINPLGDGCVMAETTVAADGSFQLDDWVGRVVVGLQYTSILSPMNLEAGAAAGTSQGKIKRIHELSIRFKDAQACWLVTADNGLEPIPFRSDSQPMDAPVEPFTGDKRISVYPGKFDSHTNIELRIWEPYPLTIVSIMPKLKTNDVF